MKPYEVELLVAEVGADPEHDAMYHVLYDGVVLDERDHAVLGGNAESISEALNNEFQAGMSLAATLQLGARVLAPDGDPLGPEQLEVALLDRSRARRAFRRLRNGELESLLATS
jgi:proteasome alpha subunit